MVCVCDGPLLPADDSNGAPLERWARDGLDAVASVGPVFKAHEAHERE